MELKCVHYWHIDSSDVGKCQKCEMVKDFGKLMRQELRKRKTERKRQPDLN